MTFEVRVAGAIDIDIDIDSELRGLGATGAAVERTGTVIRGEDTDESALFGLLARLRELGFEIVEIRRIPGLTPISPGKDPAGEESADTGGDA